MLSRRACAPLAPLLGPKRTVEELGEFLLVDEGVSFVDPTSERVCVTELSRGHASPAAVQARRKEIEDLDGHDFGNGAHRRVGGRRRRGYLVAQDGAHERQKQ